MSLPSGGFLLYVVIRSTVSFRAVNPVKLGGFTRFETFQEVFCNGTLWECVHWRTVVMKIWRIVAMPGCWRVNGGGRRVLFSVPGSRQQESRLNTAVSMVEGLSKCADASGAGWLSNACYEMARELRLSPVFESLPPAREGITGLRGFNSGR